MQDKRGKARKKGHPGPFRTDTILAPEARKPTVDHQLCEAVHPNHNSRDCEIDDDDDSHPCVGYLRVVWCPPKDRAEHGQGRSVLQRAGVQGGVATTWPAGGVRKPELFGTSTSSNGSPFVGQTLPPNERILVGELSPIRISSEWVESSRRVYRSGADQSPLTFTGNGGPAPYTSGQPPNEL